jgi:hypothetical protein
VGTARETMCAGTEADSYRPPVPKLWKVFSAGIDHVEFYAHIPLLSNPGISEAALVLSWVATNMTIAVPQRLLGWGEMFLDLTFCCLCT